MEVINKTLNGLACLVGTLLRTSNISVPASARFEGCREGMGHFSVKQLSEKLST